MFQSAALDNEGFASWSSAFLYRNRDCKVPILWKNQTLLSVKVRFFSIQILEIYDSELIHTVGQLKH